MLADFEDFADIGVIERGDSHRLKAEPLPCLWVGSHARQQQLNGDLTIEPRVARTVHDAHAALANGTEDLVRTKASSSN